MIECRLNCPLRIDGGQRLIAVGIGIRREWDVVILWWEGLKFGYFSGSKFGHERREKGDK